MLKMAFFMNDNYPSAYDFILKKPGDISPLLFNK